MFVIRFVLRLCRPYWKPLLLIAVCMAVETAYLALSPLSFKYLIDDAFLTKNLQMFVLVLAFLVGGGALHLGAGLWGDHRLAQVNEQAVYDLRSQMLKRMAGQSLDFYNRFEQGSLMNRLTSDISAVDRTLSGVFPKAVREILALLIGIGLLFQLEWKLALAMVAGFLLLFASPYLVRGKAERASVEYRKQNDSYIGVIDELLKGHRVIIVMNAAGYIWKRAEQRLTALFTTGVRVTFLYAILGRIPLGAFLALNGLVIGLGGYLIFQGQLTVGAFVAFYTIFMSVGQSVSSLSQTLPSLLEAGVSFGRIDEVLQYRSQVSRALHSEPLQGIRTDIRFCDVSFGYEEKSLALENVSLTIPVGGMTAFVGPSGSGKTTALQLLLRFYDPAQGSVEVDGRDLRELDIDDFRRLTGVVLQDSLLFHTTLLENMKLVRPEAADEEVYAAAKAARIHEMIVRLPDGYHTMVKDYGMNFSGGQRQRMAIARALMGNPKLLVFDEITSALDPATEAEINELIESFHGQRTMVMVTHRLDSVTKADVIVVFHNGKVAETGTHNELLRRGGLYADMWEKQHGFSISEDGLLAKVESERLSKLPFFREIPDKQLSLMSGLFVTEKYESGYTVVRENEPGDKFYIIVRGRVSVMKSGVTVAVLEDGDYFGEIALLRDIPRTADIVMTAPTVLLSLRREQFLNLTEAFPNIRKALERTLEERMK